MSRPPVPPRTGGSAVCQTAEGGKGSATGFGGGDADDNAGDDVSLAGLTVMSCDSMECSVSSG